MDLHTWIIYSTHYPVLADTFARYNENQGIGMEVLFWEQIVSTVLGILCMVNDTP